MSAPVRPLVLLTTESEQNLDSFRRALRRNPEFSVYVIVADEQARPEVVRRLRAWSGTPGMPELRVLDEDLDYDILMRTLEGGDGQAALPGVVIADLDRMLERDGARTLRSFNLARDGLAALITGPLVIVGTEAGALELSRRAPDLFDVRTASYTVKGQVFEPPALAPGMTLEGYVWKSTSQELAEVRAARARLEHLERTAQLPDGALADAWISIAFDLQNHHEIMEAEEAALRARTLAERAGYRDGFAISSAILGRTAFQVGRHEEAEQILRLSVKYLRQSSNASLRSRVLQWLARALMGRGRFQEAKAVLREALAAHGRSGPEGIALLIDLGDLFSRLGRRRDAEKHFKEALDRARKENESLGKANALCGLAFLERDRSAAERLLREALQEYQRMGHDAGVAFALAGLGNLLLSQGRFSEATDELRNAVDLHRKTANVQNLRNALRGLASVLTRTGHYDEAASHLREVIRLDESAVDYRRRGQDLALLSELLVDADRAFEAATAASEAVTLLTAHGAASDLARALRVAGSCARRLERVREAETHWRDAAQLLRRENDIGSLAFTLSDLADLLAGMARPDEARLLRIEAAELFIKIGDTASAERMSKLAAGG